MAKNVRWLFSKMGTTDISKIGDGTVMGALTSLNDGLTTNTSDIASINSDLTNKVNSNRTFLLEGGTSIPANSDLNDYKELGTFYCSTNANVRTLENSPTTSAFRMVSLAGTNSTTNYFIYLLFDIGAHIYIREYDSYNSGTGFRDWEQIV